jgi:anti-anti-sigma regulatory factor
VSGTPEDDLALDVGSEAINAITVLRPRGVLASGTYQSLRDGIIHAALDEPNVVVVDFTNLSIAAESALSVFTSARWHVSRWPAVPIALVCEHPAGRSAVARNGITRYVPVYDTVQAAIDQTTASGPLPVRRRARAELQAAVSSLQRSRELVAEWLTAWSQPQLIPVAKVVVTTLVENTLQHTDTPPGLRVECHGSAVTVAVNDGSRHPASLREDAAAATGLSGLQIVAALCRTWGNAPTTSGKTVWALLGPESML